MVSSSCQHARLALGILIIVGLVIAHPRTALSEQAESLNISYSALVLSGAPFWIGYELKLFEREGLKVQLLYINAAPRVMAAILAGDVQISLVGINSIVSAHIQGGDPVAIAGAVNHINVSIFARPEIRAPEDLRGKRMGITRFGGLTDFAGQYALKKWGKGCRDHSNRRCHGIDGRLGRKCRPGCYIATTSFDFCQPAELPRAFGFVQIGSRVSKHSRRDDEILLEKITRHGAEISPRLCCGIGGVSYAKGCIA